MFSIPPLCPVSLFWRHGGRQPVIKEEAGPGRPGQHWSLSPPRPVLSLTSLRPSRGGVGSLLPLVSLEMIVCPGARRGGSSAPNTQDIMKTDLYIYIYIFLKTAFLSSVLTFIGPRRRFSPFGEEGGCPILLESESFITLSSARLQEIVKC